MKQTVPCSHRDLRVSMQQGTVLKQKAELMEDLKQGLEIFFLIHEQTRDCTGWEETRQVSTLSNWYLLLTQIIKSGRNHKERVDASK